MGGRGGFRVHLIVCGRQDPDAQDIPRVARLELQLPLGGSGIEEANGCIIRSRSDRRAGVVPAQPVHAF